MIRLAKRKPKLIGGSLTHVGFGLLLVGILASSAYNSPLVDKQTENYNAAVERGEVLDEQGFKVTQKETSLLLDLNQPKVLNDKYRVTYEGYDLSNQNRPGQQTYKLKFEPLNGGQPFYMYPEVYPMLTSSSAENIQWSVDPDVRTGLLNDIYLYVGGSSYVEQRNRQIEKNNELMQPAADDEQTQVSDSTETQKITFTRGQTIEIGGFKIRFVNYTEADTTSLPENTMIGVRAEIEVIHPASSQITTLEPLFAVYSKEGKSYIYSPPVRIPQYSLSIQFTRINPETNNIELTISGLEEEYQEEWVLVIAEQKPFISVVWLGTFLLMGGFSISILRHWDRERKKNDDE